MSDLRGRAAAAEPLLPLVRQLPRPAGALGSAHAADRQHRRPPGRTLLLTGIAAIVFLGVVLYAWRSPAGDGVLQTALALISGGAVGNLIDRIRLDSVTDFLRFYLGAHEWPSFNVADSAITAGVVLLAWDLFRRPDAGKKAA